MTMITVTKGQWFPLTIGNISYGGAAFDLQGATEQHKAEVRALTSIEAVEAYQYESGYPERLKFEI